MIPGVNKVFKETSPRVFCSLRCGRRKILGEGEEPGHKKIPSFVFPLPPSTLDGYVLAEHDVMQYSGRSI